jgi:hypothetical protein
LKLSPFRDKKKLRTPSLLQHHYSIALAQSGITMKRASVPVHVLPAACLLLLHEHLEEHVRVHAAHATAHAPAAVVVPVVPVVVTWYSSKHRTK